ncbi:MAG: DUF4388 domain-containing protein [Planctomycetota bacterium]
MSTPAIDKKVAVFSHVHELERRATQVEAVVAQIKRLLLASGDALPIPELIGVFGELGWQLEKSQATLGKLAAEAGIQRRPTTTAPKDSEPPCGLKGSTKSLRIPDLLGILSSQRKTGTLTIRAGDESFTLELLRGAVVHLVSNRPRPDQRIGTILVARNRISAERLEAFLRTHTAIDGPLGQALTRESLISEEDLRDALAAQVRELFRRIFEVENAQFAFIDGKVSDLEQRVCMNTMQLLLDCARLKDEAVRAG